MARPPTKLNRTHTYSGKSDELIRNILAKSKEENNDKFGPDKHLDASTNERSKKKRKRSDDQDTEKEADIKTIVKAKKSFSEVVAKDSDESSTQIESDSGRSSPQRKQIAASESDSTPSKQSSGEQVQRESVASSDSNGTESNTSSKLSKSDSEDKGEEKEMKICSKDESSLASESHANKRKPGALPKLENLQQRCEEINNMLKVVEKAEQEIRESKTNTIA